MLPLSGCATELVNGLNANQPEALTRLRTQLHPTRRPLHPPSAVSATLNIPVGRYTIYYFADHNLISTGVQFVGLAIGAISGQDTARSF